MAEASYPKKYWWVILVVVPIVLALIAIIPSVLSRSDHGSTTNNTTYNTYNIGTGMTVINNISVIAQQYEKSTGQALGDDLKRLIQQATEAAIANNHAESIRIFEQIASRAPLPAIYNNLGVEYAKTQNAAASEKALNQAIARDPQFEEARKNLAQLAANTSAATQPPAAASAEKEPPASSSPPLPKLPGGGEAIRLEPSAISAMVIEPLNRAFAAVSAIHVVEAGAARQGGSYSIKYQPAAGTTVAMNAGAYDVLMKSGSGLFTLVSNVQVKESSLTRINPNVLVGGVAIDPLTRKGFPEIKELLLVDRGTGDRRLISQSTDKLGVTLPIAPGSYDVVCKTVDDAQVEMVKGLDVKARAIARIDTNNEVAAIVVHKPNTPGLDVKAIYALLTGTDRIAGKTDAFEKPMMVYVGDVYDVALEQTAGLTRIKTKLTPKRGVLTEVP